MDEEDFIVERRPADLRIFADLQPVTHMPDVAGIDDAGDFGIAAIGVAGDERQFNERQPRRADA